ncbi:MAG TPA: Fic family protein, partial [Blastocatellia bacterium]|nr:Fic family protein [Blastocatellia bacterium]
PPQHLQASMVSACLWFTAESFTELNPVEQAAIVHLRLIELQPFEQGNARTALLAASLFTLRASLPPVIIRPEQHAAYLAALDEGLRMETRPMVELMAEALEKTLTGMIAVARKGA